jgi:hypothetical protein
MTNNTPSRNADSPGLPDSPSSTSTQAPLEVLRPGYERLSASLLNRDAVGMIEERLPGGAMAGLQLWFMDGCEGVHGGFALLTRAPIMATFLDVCLEQIDPVDNHYRDQVWFMFAVGLWLGSELQSAGSDEEPRSLEFALDRICDLHNGELPGPEAVQSVIEEAHQIVTRLMKLRPGLDRVVRAGFYQVSAGSAPPHVRGVPLRYLFILGLVATGLTHPFTDGEYLKGLKLRFDRGLDGKVKEEE